MSLVAALLAVSAPAPVAAQTPALAPGGTFWDDDGNSHEGMIEAIVAQDITQGCSSDGRNYCPSASVTRGQMATFLTRALKLPPADRDYFTDDTGSTHEDSINRVAAAQIAGGTSATTFEPTAPVTRAQMATFLANALELPPFAGINRFSDVSGTHEANINRVADAEITLGCDATGTRYCPSNAVLRGQMASFLGRALGLSPIVSDSRALTEGVRTVGRYMEGIRTNNYRTAQNLSVGTARQFADYLVKFTQIDGTFDQTETVVTTTANSTATSLGDRRWRLNLAMRWTVAGGPEWDDSVRELRSFVVVQQSDGTFRVETYHRDALPLSAYVRAGNLANTPSGPVTGRLVAQFRRADVSRPYIVNVVAVTNHRKYWVGLDDNGLAYTTLSDNVTYGPDWSYMPQIRPGQTQEVLLITEEVRAPHSAAEMMVMSYGPDPSGYEFERILYMNIPAWPR